jgi:hypothetical protein
MYLKYFVGFILVLSLSSCEFLQNKMGFNLKKSRQDTIINIHVIDEYPSFLYCDSIKEIELRTRCFKNNLYQHFSSILLEHTFTSTKSIHETVNVKIKIDKKGDSYLVGIDSVEIVREEIPILDSLIAASVHNLPKLIPAKKRGICISTEYIIPIRIDLD